MARSNDISLKEAIERLVKTYKIEGKLNEVKLLNSWEKLMGAMVANRTNELFIRDRKLFVLLSSASLREELNMNRKKILQLLNQEAGAEVIDEVVFN